MKNIMLILLLLLSLPGFALELKVGDILLQPLDCWSCTLIEEQEDTIYSHMGLVIETTPEVVVVEALASVRKISLSDFRSRNEKGQPLSVRRFQSEEAVSYIENNKAAFQKFFMDEFFGLKYDHEFLWNNFDEQGNQKLYCSEMVTKFLSGFLRIELPVKRMKFDRNRDQWLRYFQGNPPDGKWGNSPGDFERSELFYQVGEL